MINRNMNESRLEDKYKRVLNNKNNKKDLDNSSEIETNFYVQNFLKKKYEILFSF